VECDTIPRKRRRTEELMARTAIYLHAVVQAGSKIELTAPAPMREGDEVDIVLLADDGKGENVQTKSVMEILDSLPPDIGIFKSAEEVDAYVRRERDSWDHS
jgi:hypothetical protein